MPRHKCKSKIKDNFPQHLHAHLCETSNIFPFSIQQTVWYKSRKLEVFDIKTHGVDEVYDNRELLMSQLQVFYHVLPWPRRWTLFGALLLLLFVIVLLYCPSKVNSPNKRQPFLFITYVSVIQQKSTLINQKRSRNWAETFTRKTEEYIKKIGFQINLA